MPGLFILNGQYNTAVTIRGAAVTCSYLRIMRWRGKPRSGIVPLTVSLARYVHTNFTRG